MKKIFKLLSLSLLVIFLTGISCTETKKPCEENQTGTVIIRNTHVNADNYLYVDLTTDPNGIGGYSTGYLLYDGDSIEFDNIDAGTVYIWAISQTNYDNGNAWQKSTIHLNACQRFTFTWNKK